MEITTESLLLELEAIKTRQEILEKVVRLHSVLKTQLDSQGIRFHEDDDMFSQQVIGGQPIHSSFASTHRTYEEVNYIRVGLEKKWYTDMSNSGYMELQNRVKEIFDKLA